jgi:hypothetical protein
VAAAACGWPRWGIWLWREKEVPYDTQNGSFLQHLMCKMYYIYINIYIYT